MFEAGKKTSHIQQREIGRFPHRGKSSYSHGCDGRESEDAIGTKVNEDATGPVIDDSALRGLKERVSHQVP